MLKPTILLLTLMIMLIQFVPRSGQVVEGETRASKIESKPRFPGGPNALFEYLETKMKYPYSNAIEKEEVVVKLKFIVNEDGSLSNISVINRVDDDLAVAAIQILQMMPNWEPARQDGAPLAQAVILPIPFTGLQHYP
ncbi:MAG: energy transducer TonB [Saprospiraceae bacterium]|nr:energy transducer TonB [Saprospiraceae bacterium]